MNEPIRLLIVDDHSIFRSGLRSIFANTHDIAIVGEANDGQSALQLVREVQPDVVLLDVHFKGGGVAAGLELCQALLACLPAAGVIVLTALFEEQLVLQAIQHGARGYLLKDVDAADLIKSVRAVSRGESMFDSRSATVLVKNLACPNGHQPASTDVSWREREIVRLLAEGCSNRHIGMRLAISESTVKFHLRNIKRKLAARNRTEIVYTAGKLGLLR
jgi:DNA-binding NarL/FixJ family response regulator